MMRERIYKFRNELSLLVIFGSVFLTMCLAGCDNPISRFFSRSDQPKPKWHFVDSFADTSGLLLWLTSIAIMGIGACIAAAIFLPVKKLALAGIGGFGSILVLALSVKALLPWLPWVMLAFAVLAVAAGIVLFRRYVLGLHAAVAFGKDACSVVSTDELQRIKDDHSLRQLNAGVKTVIDTALSKIRSKGT